MLERNLLMRHVPSREGLSSGHITFYFYDKQCNGIEK